MAGVCRSKKEEVPNLVDGFSVPMVQHEMFIIYYTSSFFGQDIYTVVHDVVIGEPASTPSEFRGDYRRI